MRKHLPRMFSLIRLLHELGKSTIQVNESERQYLAKQGVKSRSLISKSDLNELIEYSKTLGRYKRRSAAFDKELCQSCSIVHELISCPVHNVASASNPIAMKKKANRVHQQIVMI